MAEETKAPENQNDNPTVEAEAPKADENLAALEAELTEVKERLLRTAAEMENLRRRTEREIADTRQYAITAFARDMLNVSDNLRRALESVSDEARDAAGEAVAALLEGVAMTERELSKVLAKFGVREVEAKGKKFDPNLHQAMFEVPNPDVPSGMVVEVVQTGYVLGERTLRPALVGVSKGGAKVSDKPKDAAPRESAEPTIDRSV